MLSSYLRLEVVVEVVEVVKVVAEVVLEVIFKTNMLVRWTPELVAPDNDCSV